DADPGPGTFMLTSAGDSDVMITKLTAAGHFVWSVSLGGAGTDVSWDIQHDQSDRILVAGQFAKSVDFDPTDGTYVLISATLADGFLLALHQPAPSVPVTVRVDDGRGGFDTQSFTIAVASMANRPPEIVSDPVTNAFAGHPYTYDVDAIDPDNDSLTYSLVT